MERRGGSCERGKGKYSLGLSFCFSFSRGLYFRTLREWQIACEAMRERSVVGVLGLWTLALYTKSLHEEIAQPS